MEHNDRKDSEVASGHHYFLDHQTAYSSGPPIPVQYPERHGLTTIRHIPLEQYVFPQNFLTHEQSVVMDDHHLRMRTWSEKNSRGNVYSDFDPRFYAYLKAREIKFRNDQNQFLRSMNMIGGNIACPKALNLSLNTSQTLPALAERQNEMTNAEYFVVMGRQKLVTGTWPMQDSSSNFSNYGSRVHEKTKVQEVKSREDQHQYLQLTDTKSGYIMNSEPYQSPPNTRQILPEREMRQYRTQVEEHNLFMRGQQLEMSTWSAQDASNNTSNYGQRVLEITKVEEIISMEDQHKFLQRSNTGSWYIINSDAHLSPPNARQVLPELQYPRTEEEYNLSMRGQQLGMRICPAQESSRKDIGSKIHENPKGQEPKLKKDLHQFLGHRAARTSCTRGGDIMHLNTQHSSPNTKRILPDRNGWHHFKREKHYLVMLRRQLRKKNWPLQYLIRNTNRIGSRVHENPKGQDTKGDQHQFLGHSDSGRGGDNVHHNIQHFSPNAKQILPERDGRQYCKREEIYNSVKARRQFRMETWPMRDSRSAKTDLRSRVGENSPKEQEIKSKDIRSIKSKDLRSIKSQKKEIKNRKNNSIDEYSRKYIPAQEPCPQEWFDSHHKSGVTEDNWILMYTKGKASRVGLFEIICVLLLIAVIKFGIFCFRNRFPLSSESLDPS